MQTEIEEQGGSYTKYKSTTNTEATTKDGKKITKKTIVKKDPKGKKGRLQAVVEEEEDVNDKIDIHTKSESDQDSESDNDAEYFQKLSAQVKEECRHKSLCFYCGEEGHKVLDCPSLVEKGRGATFQVNANEANVLVDDSTSDDSGKD